VVSLTERKYSLEELLNQDALTELKDLKQRLTAWRNEKKSCNYTALKNISLTLEKIVTLLEKQDTRQKDLEDKFEELEDMIPNE